MTCEATKKNLALFLYGELSFDEEELMEVHFDECDGCREDLARQKAMFTALDSVELLPRPDALAESRAELHRRLMLTEEPLRASSGRSSGFWEKVREGFTINFHFAPGLAQVAGAAVMLALGFLTARVAPNSFLGKYGQASVLEPAMSRVRSVEPMAPGRVKIVLDETRQRVLSGSMDDESIQRLLLTAAKDPSDAGLRVESVDLLKDNSQSTEIRKALVYSLQHDPNAGVRLKALDGLKQFAGDPDTRQALTQVLLKDENPGVRTQVIDLLIQQRHTDAMVGVLQELMEKEDNNYIRMRCQKVLQEMNASAEMY
jgi:HEAT repeats/Putative zinc-finger